MRAPIALVPALACALAFACACALALACGETRRPLGDECIRSDDCLSGTCADRVCVAAPALVSGAEGNPPDDTPRIPSPDAGDASTDSGARDAASGGG